MSEFKAVEDGQEYYDLFEFNKQRAARPGTGKFSIEVYGRLVFVDLDEQQIFVDGQPVQLDLPQKLENVRWILFRRTTVTLPLNGPAMNAEKWYGIGFQGNIGEDNYQRFVFVKPDGSWVLETKR